MFLYLNPGSNEIEHLCRLKLKIEKVKSSDFYRLKETPHPLEEVLHVGWLGVDDDAVNLFTLDLLEYGAISIRICLAQMYLDVPVVRRPDELPQFYQT